MNAQNIIKALKYVKLLIVIILLLPITSCSNNDDSFAKIRSAVISQKNDIAQLATVRYMKDTLMFYTEKGKKGKLDTVLAVIKHGQVDIGYDLAKMSDKDIVMRKDSIIISLCPPEALNVIFNQNDGKKVLYSKNFGKDISFYNSAMKKLDENAREAIVKEATNKGLGQSALSQAQMFFEDMFKPLNKTVVVLVK